MDSKRVFNPYLPEWEYVPDGEPHIFNNRVWVYGSHDRKNGDSYCLEDYVVWSAPTDDLSNWTCGGTIFKKEDDPYNEKGKYSLFAPDIAKGPDGRYYLYYFTAQMERISVAVSERPDGRFRYYGDIHYPDGRLLDGGMPFDPGILSDENGNWLYYGFCFAKPSNRVPDGHKKGGYCVELEDDMITIKSKPKEVLPGAVQAKGTAFENHGFLEASSIRYIGNLYYLVYSSEQGHELCYAVSNYPDREFTYGGVIVSNADVGYNGNQEPVNYMANNHGGMVCIENQWYMFYHRHTHKNQYSRQGCAEKIQILPDGKINQAEVTSCGMSKKPLPAKGWYSSHIICGLKGPEGVLHLSSHVQRRDSDPYLYEESKNMYVANLRDGAQCTIKYMEFSGEETEIRIEYRGDFIGKIRVYAESKSDGKRNVLSEVPCVCETKDSNQWMNTVAKINKVKGIFSIYFMIQGTGKMEWNGFEVVNHAE